MPARRLLVALAAAALAFAGCSAITPAAAVVNGQKIPEERVQSEIDAARDDPSFRELLRRQGDEYRGLARRNVLTSYITFLVEEQAGRRLGVDVTAKDVEGFLDEIRTQLGGEQALRQRLKEANLTMERARELARRQVLTQKLQKAVTKDLSVPDDKVNAFYEQNKSAFTEVHLAEIVVADQSAAQQIADQASGGADFAALARERSRSPSASKGGDLGYQAINALDARTAAQLDPVPVGGVAGPIQTGQSSFSVYKVLDRRPQPIEAVRAKIEEQILAQDRESAFTAWRNEQLRKARILVNPKYGRFDTKQLQVVAGPDALPR